MINVEKYSSRAQRALQEANTLVQKHQQQTLRPAHLLLSLLEKPSSAISFLLSNSDISLADVKKEVESLVKGYPKVTGGQVYLAPTTATLLTRAEAIAQELKAATTDVEHLFVAILHVEDQATSLLKKGGLKEKKTIKTLAGFLAVTQEQAYGGGQLEALNRYAINLNERASQGKIDPVIGREEEIRRVIEVLSRRTKNNPLLIGEPGVGKTAIAEGLAQRIIAKDVPENMQNKTIWALDLGLLIAGAKYQGEFEERLKKLIKEVSHNADRIVLFIDEIHTLVGTGGSGGTMDAANILKPALARGELHTIGATTLNEHQKYIEKDRALERRFQPVIVHEPSPTDAMTILRGLKKKYELHHGVRIKDSAIVAAVNYSHRYISSRFLPDKAIDLIDQACAKKRMAIDSMPEELDTMHRAIRQLEIEREAMKQEKNSSKESELTEKLARLTSSYDALKKQWEEEKALIEQIKEMKQQLERLDKVATDAERDADYGKVAEIRYGKIPDTEKALSALYDKTNTFKESGHLLKEEVEKRDILEVVAKLTGIPVGKMVASEMEKMLSLEEALGKEVAGQPEAITAIANAVRRSRAGIQDPNRPIGSFIFLGTTGVGKTALSKALAKALFNDPKSLIRIDLSEYQERHAVSRLIGAPPGYVGYDEGGQLTEAVRQRPYAVVLLDEMEKAHSDVFNLLLQVLDEGHLTDNKGRKVNFKNTIIIMTSNLGAHILQERLQGLTADNAEQKMKACEEEVLTLLKQSVRPEFLNRIDETIVFRPITREALQKIVTIKLVELQERLQEQGIILNFDERLTAYLAKKGYDPQFGARPLARLIQTSLLNALSKEILAGSLSRKAPIKVTITEDQKIVFLPEKGGQIGTKETE